MRTGERTIIPLSEAADAAAAGRKAANLALLAGAGFDVPRGFVLTAGPAAERLPLLPGAFSALGVRLAAVRSSAAGEDGERTSFAGQFDSFLGVDAAGLEKAVLGVLASASSERVAAYGGGAARMAVIVQELVEADVSGVAFSCDPVGGGRDTVLIEAVYGLCEPLVGGRMTPDHYVLEKSGRPRELSVAAQGEFLAAGAAGGTVLRPVPEALRERPKLDASGMGLVAAAAARAEELLGRPADIEWAFKDGRLYLLQARPVTGLED